MQIMENDFFPRVGSKWRTNSPPVYDYKYVRRDHYTGDLIFWGYYLNTNERVEDDHEFPMPWKTFITTMRPAIIITTQVYIDGKPFEAPSKH
jgi:hypothetical protein